jgi:periplasmic protein TonB
MGLRCLLFSSDEGISASIRQVLDDLGVEGESCPQAATAVQLVTQQVFQFVIIDWDQQPEAGLVLAAARERKATERPLILAVVSHDHNVPKALQAGANSILRKPIALNQAKDTLKTARDLLRARQETAAAAAASAAARTQPSPSATSSNRVDGNERSLRSAEFLPSSVPAPGGQFDTESDLQKSMEQSATTEVDPLKELEPMAAAVTRAKAAPAPPPPASVEPRSDEPRGLQWYLNQRAAAAPKMAPIPPAPAPDGLSSAPAAAAPELLGFDQMATAEPRSSTEQSRQEFESEAAAPVIGYQKNEQKHEAELFAHIAGESSESEEKPRRSLRLGKGAIVWAVVLAACAVVAAPQAPWHPRVQAIWKHEQMALHAWLNPQVVTPVQAPESHENFARAGDEYKLPVAETIPDATTDPSQIRVTPVVDPTVKKSPGADASADQPAASAADGANPDAGNPNSANSSPANSGQPAASADIQVQPSPTGSAPAGAQPAGAQSGSENPSAANSPANTTTPAAVPPPNVQPAAMAQSHVDSASATAPDASLARSTPPPPTPQTRPQAQTASSTTASTTATPYVPSSLRSQIVTMVPEASGNKPPEAALPSIEPVSISEITARSLLTDQPAVAYPASAKGQKGTVVLQVLIGRDGTVEDAKFLQGSLAFAKAAIDGAKLWKFKPYMMNGRPVSVQTSLTLSFTPGS